MMTRTARENFPIASPLLSRRMRGPVRLFYDFVRAADDIADDGTIPADTRRTCLDQLDAVLAGTAPKAGYPDESGPFSRVFEHARTLHHSLKDTGVTSRHARDLLAAFRMDVDKSRWRDWDDLMAYTELSAKPVGRYLLDLAGGAHDDGRSVEALTACLQVLNHLQDVKDDFAALGRIYLPARWLEDAGVTEADLLADKASPALRSVLDRVLDRTNELIADAAGVSGDIRSFRLGLEAAVILEIARRLSAKLRQGDPLSRRIALDKGGYGAALAIGLVKGFCGRVCAPTAHLETDRMVRRSKSSFFWSMRLLGREKRTAIYGVYAFCRSVDDIADDGDLDMAEKHARLERWRRDIDAIYDGQPPHHPVARALAGPVWQFHLQKQDFMDVIEGVSTDATPLVRVVDRKALETYCDRVASAVGRLANPIFGLAGENADRLARSLGRAMQITNILRDVSEDAARNRLYVPADLLARHGLGAGGTTPEDLRSLVNDDRFPHALEDMAKDAKNLYAEAADCLGRTPSAPVRVMMEVYRRLLARLCQRGLNYPHIPVRIGGVERLWIAIRFGFFPERIEL